MKEDAHQKEAMKIREDEITKQECQLKKRQENIERQEQKRRDSESAMLMKLKEERQRREASICARLDELKKKLEFDMLEILKRDDGRSEELLPSTLVLMEEEKHKINGYSRG